MILYFFPGPNYPLVRQKILHRKICLQVCILFSLYFTDCSINTGSGGSNIYQVRMLSKFQYIIWRFFYEFFARILLLYFTKMSNSHLTYFLQIEEYNYISNGVQKSNYLKSMLHFLSKLINRLYFILIPQCEKDFFKTSANSRH